MCIRDSVSTVNFTMVGSRDQLRHVDDKRPRGARVTSERSRQDVSLGGEGRARGRRPREMPSRDEGPCRVADGQSDAGGLVREPRGRDVVRSEQGALSLFPSFRGFAVGAFSEDGVEK